MIPTRCLFLIAILVNSATSRHLFTIDTSTAFVPCKSAYSNPKLRQQKFSILTWLQVPVQKDDEERLKNDIRLENTPPSSSWNEKHLIHGVNELHEETNAELLDSEEEAAIDAHDCDDPGMEAAMMERAVMMASDMAHKMKEDASTANKMDRPSKQEIWGNEHLIHGAKQIHEETNAELLDSEEEAAIDAHGCDDPGMEAAMMERAVMMASDMAHKMKEDASTANKMDRPSKQEIWGNEHLIHGAKQIHEETNAELLDSEEEAAIDAHGCDDPGMEAAMMERAVMMASDMAHKMKKEAKK